MRLPENHKFVTAIAVAFLGSFIIYAMLGYSAYVIWEYYNVEEVTTTH